MVEMNNKEETANEFPLYGGGDEQGDEDGLGPVCYPQRPGETECQYYMKTGTCKYAIKCKFHHPPDVTPSWGTVAPATDVTIGLNKESYPRRPGEQQCTFFLKTGTCKYKMSCKFDHPPEAIQQTLQLQSTPYPLRPGELQCAYYLKTGKCKFGATCRFDHPPLAPEQAAALASAGQHPGPPGDARGGVPVMGLPRQAFCFYAPEDAPMMGMVPGPPGQPMGFPPPQQPLPQRPGEKECTFFLRTGRCQYGLRCKFHHPVEKLAGNLAASNGMNPMGGPPPHPMGPPGSFALHPGMEGYPYAMGGPGGGPQHGSMAGMRGPPPGPGGPGGAAGGPDGALPSRPGHEVCSFFMRTGKCSYGLSCRFDHPRTGVPREVSGESGNSGNSAGVAGAGGSQEGGGAGGQYQGNGGEFAGHPHMRQYGNSQGGYGGPVGPGYGDGLPPGANGGHMYPGGEAYGSPQGFMGYPPPHHGQYPAQAAVYSNYRQSS